MRALISDRDYEKLSAYIDGQLSSRERGKFEEQLRARADLRAALEDMQRMRAVLRQAPRRRAPRNFTLTPAMVGERKPRTSPWAGLIPVMSLTSALAALALVVILAVQLAPGAQPQTVAMQVPQTEAAEAAPAAEAPAAGAASAAEAQSAMRTMPTAPTDAQAESFTPTQTAVEPPAAALPAATSPAELPAVSVEPTQPAAPLPTPTLDPSAMAAAEPTLPPVVNWNGMPSGSAGGMTGLGGGMGGAGDVGLLAGAPFPGAPDGRGKGGGGGGDGSMPPGSVYLPPESVETAPQGGTSTAPDLSASVEGAGPILGVPSAADSGQIIDRQALDATTPEAEPTANPEISATPVVPTPVVSATFVAPTPVVTATSVATATAGAVAVVPENQAPPQIMAAPEQAAAPEDAAASEDAAARGVLGLDPRALLALEIALGAVALAAGAAAFVLWRRRGSPRGRG